MAETISQPTPRLLHADLTRGILAAAMRVHQRLGPGLLEGAYRACFARQLSLDGFCVKREVAIPVRYEGMSVEHGYRADIIVDDAVLVELKAVERLLPIHEAQLLTYLKLADLKVGLLINFNVLHLRHGFMRFVR
jgi:GxxExxY protein